VIKRVISNKYFAEAQCGLFFGFLRPELPVPGRQLPGCHAGEKTRRMLF